MDAETCARCHHTGWVCEQHPTQGWNAGGACGPDCAGPGMPCPSCNPASPLIARLRAERDEARAERGQLREELALYRELAGSVVRRAVEDELDRRHPSASPTEAAHSDDHCDDPWHGLAFKYPHPMECPACRNVWKWCESEWTIGLTDSGHGSENG